MKIFLIFPNGFLQWGIMMQSKKTELVHIMCVDLEEWYDINLASGIDKVNAEKRVKENVDILLKIFDRENVKATFFVVGSIAEQYPEMLKLIRSRGHEIGCHSYAHKLIYEQSPEEFRKDTVKAKSIIEDIIGEDIVSYRAPSWSITKKSFWALKILQEEGFKYDSSIFPFENFLYGVKDAPEGIYSTQKYNEQTNMIECPPSVIKIGKFVVPYSGGTYIRFLPYVFVKLFININSKNGRASVVYIHPWEIDKNTPRIKMRIRDRIITYFGINRNFKKLNNLIRDFKFDSMKNCLNN